MAAGAERPPEEPSRRVQALELGVFLFLIAPSLALAYLSTQSGSLSFRVLAGMTILRDLSLLCLVLYFLWRNGERVRQIGWTKARAGTDVLWGIALFFPLTVVTAWLDALFRQWGLSAPTTLPSFFVFRGAGDLLLAFLLVVTVAVVEESLFRGYLIRRFTAVSGSLPLAILLSAAVFSLGHHYEGGAGVLTAGIFGVIMAVVYRWRRSLVAPMVIHFLQDFTAIILIPLLANR